MESTNTIITIIFAIAGAALFLVLGFLVHKKIHINAIVAPTEVNTALPALPPPPTVIPLNIFQTWHTKKLPTKMQECVRTLQTDNPEFKYYLYDDQDCRKFLQEHYDVNVLYAYDSLVPGAFKADLWRYCVLYKYGGIYLDIKYQCINGFKLMQLTDDEYFVRDRYDVLNKTAVYNALMVCKAGNPILKRCIDQVVQNVRQRYYGESALDPTGPTMMIQFFTPMERMRLKRLEHYDEDGKYYIVYRGSIWVKQGSAGVEPPSTVDIPVNTKILMMYPEYRTEQRQFQKTQYYADLWKRREIFSM